jgi:ATP-dependent helicase/nuclease subunit A
LCGEFPFDPPAMPAALPWSADEQTALQHAGCLPWRPEAALAAEATAWRRPILAARDRTVLVAIRAAGSEVHPLVHELAPVLEPNPALRPRAEGLVGEFALPQGRSPVAAVVPEAAQKRLFRIAADAVIGRHAPVLGLLATRFGFHEGQRPADWRAMLGDLVATARLNGLDAAALEALAERSWAGLRAALPDSAEDGTALDEALRDAVDRALKVLGGGDGVGGTTAAIDLLRRLRRDAAEGSFGWPDWARMAKQKASAGMDGLLVPVRTAAARHPWHPRLHADLERFIHTLFTAAAEAMAESQAYKRRRGLVDFVDQEAEALALLEDPAAAAHIAGSIDVLLVDEFQDTSPIQLALFLRLARQVPRTLFVGDAKQAIYGFRGADPALVAAVVGQLVQATGRPVETLGTNRRSRPALVAFTPQQHQCVLSLVKKAQGSAVGAVLVLRGQSRHSWLVRRMPTGQS